MGRHGVEREPGKSGIRELFGHVDQATAQDEGGGVGLRDSLLVATKRSREKKETPLIARSREGNLEGYPLLAEEIKREHFPTTTLGPV